MISPQITLWNQQGSEVIQGTLLVIPIEESLIYIRPLYLKAAGGQIPELKRVIVAYQNNIVMEATLDAALERIFPGGGVRARPAGPAGRAQPAATPLTATSGAPGAGRSASRSLAEQARAHYQRALQAQRDGNWALYGEEIKKLGDVLERMRKTSLADSPRPLYVGRPLLSPAEIARIKPICVCCRESAHARVRSQWHFRCVFAPVDRDARSHIAKGRGTCQQCSSVLIILLAASGAEAQSSSAKYRFTTLLDSQAGLVPTRCPAINGLGTVAVLVEDTLLGFDKLITKRGARDEPVVVAHTERLANYPTFCDNGFTQIMSNASINELGEVAFQGNLRRLSAPDACLTPEQRDTPRQGVFLGDGGPLTTIAHTNNPPGSDFISEFIVADVTVNSFGKVALAIELRGEPLFDQGLFVGSRQGSFDERFRNSTSEFDSPSSRMSLNELGRLRSRTTGSCCRTPTARSGDSSTAAPAASPCSTLR